VQTHSHQRPIFALLLRLLAIIALSTMLALVKLADESGLSLPEILFWRQFPALPIVFGILLASGRLDSLRTKRMPQHVVRMVIGLTSMSLNFTAFTLLPLAEATTLSFTSAIWAVILSALILREHVGIWRWSAVALGFVGILIIAQPGSGHFPLLGALVGMAAAFMIAVTSIYIRDMTQTENSLTIVFYFTLFSLPILGAMLPFFWVEKTATQWLMLIGIGLVGFIGQYLLTVALRYGTVSSVIVMDYSGLIWSTLLGWAIFEKLPVLATWLGGPLIVAAGLIITWREHRLAIPGRDTTNPG